MQNYFDVLQKEQKAKTTKNTKAKQYNNAKIAYISYRIYGGKIRMQITNAKYCKVKFLQALELDLNNVQKQVYTLVDSNKAKIVEQLAKQDSKEFMQNANAFVDIEQKAKEEKMLVKLQEQKAILQNAKEQKAKTVKAKDNK